MSGAGAKRIDQWEITRYWEIFASLVPAGTDPATARLTGAAAASVLKNSRLRDDQLERVWDLADVDGDGMLDFEEFCVAMRLVFDLVNGEMAEVPRVLPDWLVPEGKAHLVQASRAVAGAGETFERPQDDELDGDSEGLRDGFDWYMTPAQRREYEDMYADARDGHGYVAFDALADLYATLDVPDTDVRSAWNLVNPSADEVIGRDACLAFLHALRGRHDGFRIPRAVPPSLRATFERRDVDFNVDRARSTAARNASSYGGAGGADDNTPSARKAKFGDAYLSRLGGGGDRKYSAAPRGTDFAGAGAATPDWEEVRLKRQLRELTDKVERVEALARRRAEDKRDSRPALVKRELEQLLDYKRRELADLESGGGRARECQSLAGIRGEIDTVKEQVDGLEGHLRARTAALDDLRRQVAEEKAR